MNLVQRVQGILLNPRTTWPVIRTEPDTPASIYKNYVMILGLIPAICTFVGLSLIGPVPIIWGLINMVVSYLLSLIMVFVQALIIDALAPTFEGTKDSLAAFKLAAYGSTAGFIGGIFALLPALAFLGVVVGLYGIYLFYTGLPVLMKCPPKKTVAYTVVVIVCSIVSGFAVGLVLALLRP